VIKEALDDLISFTRLHFQDEEQVMTATGYPAREKHKIQHQALLDMLLAFQRSTDAGDPLSNIGMLELLKGWLCNHVPSEDTKLAEWYRTQDSKRPAWKFR
jgi:methyl-accepting chemotaxis protein